MHNRKPDFAGWATRSGIRCSDGRTIMKDAFTDDNGRKVPLVWMHQHNSPADTLGHAMLFSKDGDVWAECYFNETDNGKIAKTLVQNGDVTSMSIFANQLKQVGNYVKHGVIQEVSLVLAGANPGATIQNVIAHSDDDGIDFIDEESAWISHGDQSVDAGRIEISDDEEEDLDAGQNGDDSDEPLEDDNSDATEKSVKDILSSMDKDQLSLVLGLMDFADKDESDNNDSDEGGSPDMKHNAFDPTNDDTLQHAELMNEFNSVLDSGVKGHVSSLKALFEDQASEKLMHGLQDDHGDTIDYGIANIDYLFPEARTTSPQPSFIKRDMEWVPEIMRGAKHLPFSRVKTQFADITMDEARAKGYTKGHKKTEEVFKLLKRTTTPTTIYKKQKLDRDDIVDITSLDVVTWLKGEMRMMLDEEIARAALVGDGRLDRSEDKISEDNIRPIYTDDVLFTVRSFVDGDSLKTEDERARAFIRQAKKARKEYRGTGNPTMFTTEDLLTDCLLLEDKNGRVIYDTVEKLQTALRVKKIVTVPVMEGLTREGTSDDVGKDFDLMAIFVNMSDYSFGADRGGAVSLFDDFDIDFNQYKYLIETRCSGALTIPKSAIVMELKRTHSA